MLLLAYSQGGGTYTGLEAVSNNVNLLAEPRVRTGKMTMLYMALSLAVTAGGIIMLYLLWDAQHVPGETLNASTFKSIINHMNLGGPVVNQVLLAVVLAFEAGLLFVAANTGFLGGPSVLSNMAADSWVPHKFRYLSTRLVTQNGILVMGLAALAILWWTGGSVTLLVVLYSISVFLTFAISLFGLWLYWVRNRKKNPRWLRRFLLSLVGFTICAGILVILLIERFAEGGWATALIIGGIAAVCVVVRNHYRETKRAIHSVGEVFSSQPFGPNREPVEPDPQDQTAVFIVGNSRGGAVASGIGGQQLGAELEVRVGAQIGGGDIDAVLAHHVHGAGVAHTVEHQGDDIARACAGAGAADFGGGAGGIHGADGIVTGDRAGVACQIGVGGQDFDHIGGVFDGGSRREGGGPGQAAVGAGQLAEHGVVGAQVGQVKGGDFF
eukprot:gene18639-21212_t